MEKVSITIIARTTSANACPQTVENAYVFWYGDFRLAAHKTASGGAWTVSELSTGASVSPWYGHNTRKDAIKAAVDLLKTKGEAVKKAIPVCIEKYGEQNIGIVPKTQILTV